MRLVLIGRGVADLTKFLRYKVRIPLLQTRYKYFVNLTLLVALLRSQGGFFNAKIFKNKKHF